MNNRAYHLVSWLLEAGADPNCRTENHDTPLHIAARKNMAAAVQWLMDKEADPATRNAEGRTACEVAYKQYCL
jgi:ankyrin repeat protein